MAAMNGGMAAQREAAARHRPACWISEQMITAKRTFLIACVLLLVGFSVCIGHLIPSGLGGIKQVIPYLLFSIDRGAYMSPGGTSKVRVVSNDAGAAHSGNFPTWVILQHWWGKQVVAKGYMESPRGVVPAVWLDETTFSITFVKNRHGGDNETVTVRLR